MAILPLTFLPMAILPLAFLPHTVFNIQTSHLAGFKRHIIWVNLLNFIDLASQPFDLWLKHSRKYAISFFGRCKCRGIWHINTCQSSVVWLQANVAWVPSGFECLGTCMILWFHSFELDFLLVQHGIQCCWEGAYQNLLCGKRMVRDTNCAGVSG